MNREHYKARRNFSDEPPERFLTWDEQLVVDLLAKAGRDWNKFGEMKEEPRRHVFWNENPFKAARNVGFSNPHDELIAFFSSDWYLFLCSYIDMDPLMLIDRLGVPVSNEARGSLSDSC